MPQKPSGLVRLRDRIINLFASPITAAFLALLAPLTGFWVALRGTQIKVDLQNSIPNLPPILFGIGADTAVFLLLLGSIGVGWTLHKWAEAARTRRRQLELHDTVEYATSLGLHGAAEELRVAVKDGFYTTLETMNRPNVPNEDIASSIRVVLGNLAYACREFDWQAPSDVYSASLFLFHSSSDLRAMKEPRRRDLLAEQKFYFFNQLSRDPDQLKGVLELRRELSTSTRDLNHGQDHSTPEIVLPVPERERAQQPVGADVKYGVLPGAPFAASLETYTAFESIAELEKWLSNSCTLGENVRVRLMEFFASGPGKDVKSFIAIPILVGSKLPQILVGVVALQRSTPGMLERGRHTVFVNLATPMLLFLGFLGLEYRRRLSV